LVPYRRFVARYGRWPHAVLLGLLLFAFLVLLLPAFALAFLAPDDGSCLCQGPQSPGDPLAVVCFLDASHCWAHGTDPTIVTTGCDLEAVTSGVPAPQGRAFTAASVGRPPPRSD
jgi:hypothetical protein